jgi:hypothetical protein
VANNNLAGFADRVQPTAPLPALQQPPPIRKYTEVGAKRAQLLKGRKYRSRNYMAITEREGRPDNVSRAVLGMLDRFEEKYSRRWRGRHITRPADIERYLAWIYVTGSRKREPFLRPYPRITLLPRQKGLPWRIVRVERVIEKSFVKGTRDRAVHEQNIPIFDSTEDKLWRKILDDYESLDLDDLFGRMEKLDAHHGLTGLIQRNFRCDMREEGTGRLLKNAPVSPHAFRHHRAYNLHIERELEADLVVSLFGWKDPRMLSAYAYISNRAKGRAQINALKRYLTSSHQ